MLILTIKINKKISRYTCSLCKILKNKNENKIILLYFKLQLYLLNFFIINLLLAMYYMANELIKTKVNRPYLRDMPKKKSLKNELSPA